MRLSARQAEYLRLLWVLHREAHGQARHWNREYQLLKAQFTKWADDNGVREPAREHAKSVNLGLKNAKTQISRWTSEAQRIGDEIRTELALQDAFGLDDPAQGQGENP